MACRLFRWTAPCATLARQIIGGEDVGSIVTTMTNTATTLVTARCRGHISSDSIQMGSDGLLTGGEGRDDDLVEREDANASMPAGEKCRADLRQDQ